MCQLVLCDDLEEWDRGEGGERVVQEERDTYILMADSQHCKSRALQSNIMFLKYAIEKK